MYKLHDVCYKGMLATFVFGEVELDMGMTLRIQPHYKVLGVRVHNTFGVLVQQH